MVPMNLNSSWANRCTAPRSNVARSSVRVQVRRLMKSSFANACESACRSDFRSCSHGWRIGLLQHPRMAGMVHANLNRSRVEAGCRKLHVNGIAARIFPVPSMEPREGGAQSSAGLLPVALLKAFSGIRRGAVPLPVQIVDHFGAGLP